MDNKIAKKLYQVSRAGVKIKLICRGICVIKPGVKGISENIEIVSIVDRFLEHSRVFIFANAANPKYFLGLADWIVRNFDHRFEVITPIYEKNIQEELMDIVNIQLSYNVYRQKNQKEPVRAQFKTYDYLKEKYG